MAEPTVTPDAPEILPLPPDGRNSLQAWRSRVEADLEKLKPIIEQGKTNVQRYRSQVLSASLLRPGEDQVVVPLDFSYVEQKKAQLFPNTPEVQLDPQLPGLEQATVVFQAVVNQMIGPTEMNTKATMGEIVFDLLCPTGVAAVKIGYENAVEGTKPVLIAPPGVDPLGQPTPPQVAEVPNVVYERYYMDRISPGCLIVPHVFHGSDFDRADYLGRVYFEDLEDGETAPRSSGGGQAKQDMLLSNENAAVSYQAPPQRRCLELFYRASRFDTSVTHPELFRQLILKDGQETPAVHRDSPYQRKAPDGTYLGMCGNPIHVFTLRYVSDSAFPPSDCTMSRAPIDEVSRGRTQMIQQRARSLPMRGVDKSRMSPDEIEALKSGRVQSIILTDGPPSEIIQEIARADLGRENFEFDRIGKEDASAVWALQVRGANEDAGRTATEAAYKKQTTDDRMDYERTRLLDLYCAAVAKAAALKQLFATDQSYVQVVGPDGAKQLQAWDKTTIAGKYVFRVRPDSAIRLDVAAERKQYLDLYNLTANDPHMNRMELGRKLTQSYGLDPARLMQAPPPPKPEPKAASISISSTSLSPLAPESPICLEVLQQSGYTISVQAVQNALALARFQMQQPAADESTSSAPAGNAPHGGPAEGLEPISKHSAGLTGKLSGPGAVQ